jgi:photosystem II stability/assembly factor-like uncharacterized protein
LKLSRISTYYSSTMLPVCSHGRSRIRVPALARCAGVAILLLSFGHANVAAAPLPPLAVQALAVDPTNAQIVYAGTTNGVYKTIDGGSNWSRVDSGLTFTNVLALAIHASDPCTIYAGIDSGLDNIFAPPNIIVRNTTGILAVSQNCGNTWGVAAGAPLGRAIRSLAFASAGPFTLYASMTVNTASLGTSLTQHRIARMRTGSTDFSFAFEDFFYVVAVDPANPCAVYIGGLSGTVRRNSSCGTLSWSTVGMPFTASGNPTQANTIAVAPSGQPLLAGTGAGVIFRKADEFSAWSPVATVAGSINSIVYDPGNPQVVYAAGSGGVAYKSVDGGSTWTPMAVLGSGISALAAGAAPGLRLYGAGNSFVATLVPGAVLPTVVTLGASGVGGTGATLSATVNPHGSSTTARFEWGPTASYGSQASVMPAPGSGTSPVAVSTTVGGLTCNTLYHFRATATNPAGTAAGADVTFITPPTGCPFTDTPISSGITPIKSVHIIELRVRIDILRGRYGLQPFAWTDPSLTAGATMVRAQHLVDLRAALAAAYSAATQPPPTYTDPGLGIGTPVKGAHVAELRAAVIALE